MHTNMDRIPHADKKYEANNYHPLSVVLAKGKGPKVWDVDGTERML
jgi:acetylornithine/succinyldiaminopimelate/putrescine aminotransferase